MRFEIIKQFFGDIVEVRVGGADLRGVLSVVECSNEKVDKSMVRLSEIEKWMQDVYDPYWIVVKDISAIRRIGGITK